MTFIPLGQVPLSWAEPRILGSAEHFGSYADLYGSEWIGILRGELAADGLALGLVELDASTLQRTSPRTLTQRASRLAFRRGFDGIHYFSKYGHDIRNWALFEPFKITSKDAEPIDFADPELMSALAIHRLQIGAT